jgi:hypothetical protein
MNLEAKVVCPKLSSLLVSIKGNIIGNYSEFYQGKGQTITQNIFIQFNCKEKKIKDLFFFVDKNIILEKILEEKIKLPLLVEDPHFSSILESTFKIKRNYYNEFWAEENVYNQMKKILEEIQITKRKEALKNYHQTNFISKNTEDNEEDDWEIIN